MAKKKWKVQYRPMSDGQRDKWYMAHISRNMKLEAGWALTVRSGPVRADTNRCRVRKLVKILTAYEEREYDVDERLEYRMMEVQSVE